MYGQHSLKTETMIGKVILKKYTLQKKLGEGSFGMIYKATSDQGEFALKFEKRAKGNLLLETEGYIMNYLKGPGIPLFKSYTPTSEYNILVMELLGKSLENLLSNSKNKKFSVRTVCNSGIQMLDIIRRVHDKHIIHRDIKPDNFAIGLNEESSKIYLIDFGLAKKYRSSRTLEQYPMKTGKKLTGTARYASINALGGVEQSRRDDLESIGYVLLYFLRGSLPWQGLPIKRKDDRYKRILEKKKSTLPSELCKGFPKEFEEFIVCARNLGYTEEPPYDFLINLMKNVLAQEKFEFDYYCDWNNNCLNNHTLEDTPDCCNCPRSANQNITIINQYYHQVNNIVVNRDEKDEELDEEHKDKVKHKFYLKTDEAQCNENSKSNLSFSPMKINCAKSRNTNINIQQKTTSKNVNTNIHNSEVPLYHKISSVGNNKSRCCEM